MIIATQLDSDHDDLEEITHDPKRDVWDDELVVDQVTTLGYHSSMHPPSINDVDGIICRFSVLRCVLAQPKESGNWRRSTIFQTHLNK